MVYEARIHEKRYIFILRRTMTKSNHSVYVHTYVLGRHNAYNQNKILSYLNINGGILTANNGL